MVTLTTSSLGFSVPAEKGFVSKTETVRIRHKEVTFDFLQSLRRYARDHDLFEYMTSPTAQAKLCIVRYGFVYPCCEDTPA